MFVSEMENATASDAYKPYTFSGAIPPKIFLSKYLKN